MIVAIVVAAYNRVDSVSRLLSSLSAAHYQQVAPLIISVDKSDTDEVECFAESYDWNYGPKKVVKHTENLGLRKHILSLGEYTKEFDAVIVLEDDLVVSPCFYDYALSAVEEYQDCKEVAGISLYSFPFNPYLSLPFHPQKDEFDIYMMQIAMSWGQVWMRKQWIDFANWYSINNGEFDYEPHLPENICKWGRKSWLKYHDKYCIENNKYFVYPYVSLTSNMGTAGTHSAIATNINQTIMQGGLKYNFNLPSFGAATKYDGFFERVSLCDFLQLDDEVCIDLYGLKKNATNTRYWLTTELANYKILNSFGLQYYPIEMNVLYHVSGHSIFLYDTKLKAKNSFNDNTFDLINYHFKIRGIYTLMKRKGFLKVILKFIKVFFTKQI